MLEKIKKVLEAGIKAPSGSNSQPWKFKIKENRAEIWAEYEKDHPVLNYRNRGTLIAIGALLENISIAGPVLGLMPKIQTFPDKDNLKFAAIVDFEENNPEASPLFDAINLRTTNRKPYNKVPLSSDQKQAILGLGKDFPQLQIKLEERSDQLAKLGSSSSMNEVITLENQELHRLFFNEINWNQEQDEQRRMGFYLKTMELDSPKRMALRLFKNWPVMNTLNKLGVGRGIAASNAKVYASAGAIGIITARDLDEDFLEAGQLMERIWLYATSIGLSFALVTGILYFWQRMKAGGLQVSDEHKKIISAAYADIARIFSVSEGRVIAVLFRIGQGGQPSARSIRIPLDKLIIN